MFEHSVVTRRAAATILAAVAGAAITGTAPTAAWCATPTTATPTATEPIAPAPTAPAEPAPAAEPKIDADFPGGNIIVERIEGDTVYLRQDLRDTQGHWFYWSMRVRGAAGRTLTFQFTNGDVLTRRGPAYSLDGGRTWAWLADDHPETRRFQFAFPPRADEVRFCTAIPYVEDDLKRFLRKYEGGKHLAVEELTRSRKGRSVERLRVGRLEGEPDTRVLLTCRHHACEMMAGWVLEGIIDAALADDETGRWYRQHVELLAVPFMDMDGVEDGDQGKNRKPFDHNRDYMDKPIYPEVAALKRFVPEWSKGKLRAAFDLHCPVLRGGGNEQLVFVGSRYPAVWEEQKKFAEIVARINRGPLPYDPKNNMPFGVGWNNLAEPRSSSAWSGALEGVRLAGTWEIPYGNAGGKPVTVESARSFGRTLAEALREYLGGTNQP